MEFWHSLSLPDFYIADTFGNLLRYLVMAGGTYPTSTGLTE